MYTVRGFLKMLPYEKTTLTLVDTEEKARQIFNDEEKLAELQEDCGCTFNEITIEKMTYVVTEIKSSNMKEYVHVFDNLEESDKYIKHLKYHRPHGTSEIYRERHYEIIEKKEMVKH